MLITDQANHNTSYNCIIEIKATISYNLLSG